MQAIVTKYHGPTNTRGARYSASTESGHRISVAANHALDAKENHERAARALMTKLGWTGKIAGGGIKSGYAWVFAEGARDPARDARKKHPRGHRSKTAPTFAKQAQISRKIRLLVKEGYPPKQATAIAYRMAGVPARPAKRRTR
jgi:hypothetical protein